MAIDLKGDPSAHYNAGAALDRLGRPEEAARHMERAIEEGIEGHDLRPTAARILNAEAREREKKREWEAARDLYRRSLRIHPDPVENAPARQGLRRLEGRGRR